MYELELDSGANRVASLNVKTSAGIVRTINGEFVDQEWTFDVTGSEIGTWSGGTAIYQVKLSSVDGITVVTVDGDIMILENPLNTELSSDELALEVLEKFRYELLLLRSAFIDQLFTKYRYAPFDPAGN